MAVGTIQLITKLCRFVFEVIENISLWCCAVMTNHTIVWSFSRQAILSMMEDMILATDVSRNKRFMSQFEVSAHVYQPANCITPDI